MKTVETMKTEVCKKDDGKAGQIKERNEEDNIVFDAFLLLL